ncbi:leucyl aminopeptidase [Arenimonas sp.]|jgi:leucyl aminopeptidase|uniref:leucyl aminopeptidase n=1 Tax=Arenimonas sp. TaxID=1872635 RepID=UPI0037C0B893
MTKAQLLTRSLLSLALSAAFSAQAATSISFSQQAQSADTQVLLVSPDSLKQQQHPMLQDARVQQAINAEQFSAQYGKKLELLAPATGVSRLLLLGTGDTAQLTAAKTNTLGGDLTAYLQGKSSLDQASIDATVLDQHAPALAQGMELRAYTFDKYHTRKSKPKDLKLALVVPDQRVAATRFEPLAAVNAGVFLARDLTNEPADAVYPESFAAAALELKKLGVKVEVLDEAAMARLGMGAILAVGKGSNRPPRMVIAHWQNSKQAPLAIVGKGITFDTGGYNLKTDAASIFRMNSDMAGAAAVLGTVKALALQNAPVNVVAVMALAENKISDRAMLPGDVIKSASGLTIQVGNTDAEGRLVLADGLWYARDKYKPRAIVDIATLTGSKVGALGNYYAGIFSEHEALTQQLISAGRQVDEELWQLPLNSKFADEMKSDIADLNNNGKTTGASSAAWFLQQFTGDTPWAHLDIAGNALSSSDKGVHVTGATGYGVRLLTEWALKQP